MIEIPKWMFDAKTDELPEVYQNLVDVVGYQGMLNLIANYGGDYKYIPKLDQLQRQLRDQNLMADYSAGRTPQQLAHKYNLSVVQVYEIIKQQNFKSGIKGDQLSLLPDGA
jgi:Mor family transcriptional regulator